MNETRIKKKLHIIIKNGCLSQLEIDNNAEPVTDKPCISVGCIFYCTLLQLRDAIENKPAYVYASL